MSGRLENLRASLETHKLNGILVSAPENRRYLSGFTGSAGYLLVTQKDAILTTDFRYIEQAGSQAPDFRVHRIGAGYEWLPQLLEEAGVTRLGFESEDVSVALHHRLVQMLKAEAAPTKVKLVSTAGIVEALRAHKDLEEMALLQKAIDIADEAFTRVAPTIRPGETESAVAWRLEVAMRKLGAEGPSFDTIVGAGPNGALPHHRAGDRIIQEGEPIVIDMGARYKGYCSDMTRTIVLGTPGDAFKRVYDVVLGAQLTAMATVQTGMTGAEADGLARKVIVEASHGEQFGHSLGHGVGLAVHEFPRLSPTANEKLEKGMVFTIEPGIYLPGWGGVRIEDIVILEDKGARALSKAKKGNL